MTLKRLTPLVNQRDLGNVRLWRDELAEIVRLMRQLDGVNVRVEADDYIVGDIETDLPQVGRKLHHFEAAATRESPVVDGPALPELLLEVTLSQGSSRIKAEDPDLQTIGAIEAIYSLTERCRRLPSWLGKFVGRPHKPRKWRWRWRWFLFIPLILIVLPGLVGLQSFLGYALGGLILIICVRWILANTLARTVLYTGTRAEAPTWWQEHRSDVGINAAFSVIFLILGAMIGHYWH